jgi:hypothetical protein
MGRSHCRTVLSLLILLGLLVGGCSLFPNRRPIASFIVRYNDVPGKPLAVILDASGSSDPDGDAIVAYMWTFDPAAESIHPLAVHSQRVYVPTVVAEFLLEGEYEATLAVEDEAGKTSFTVKKPVIVPSEVVGPTE